MIFGETPSQTVGPYLAIGLPFDTGPNVVPEDTPGQITITGTVYDGAGDPIPDNMIETWQADGNGNFADLHDHGGPSDLPGFRGFARSRQRRRRRIVRDPDRQTRPGPRPRRHPPGPTHRRLGVRPRAPSPRHHPHLLRRRERRQRSTTPS